MSFDIWKSLRLSQVIYREKKINVESADHFVLPRPSHHERLELSNCIAIFDITSFAKHGRPGPPDTEQLAPITRMLKQQGFIKNPYAYKQPLHFWLPGLLTRYGGERMVFFFFFWEQSSDLLLLR